MTNLQSSARKISRALKRLGHIESSICNFKTLKTNRQNSAWDMLVTPNPDFGPRNWKNSIKLLLKTPFWAEINTCWLKTTLLAIESSYSMTMHGNSYRGKLQRFSWASGEAFCSKVSWLSEFCSGVVSVISIPSNSSNLRFVVRTCRSVILIKKVGNAGVFLMLLNIQILQVFLIIKSKSAWLVYTSLYMHIDHRSFISLCFMKALIK